MAHTYVIGDVHGCYDQLQELLDLVSPASDDHVWFLGDYVDRGPKSAETLVWCVDKAPDNFHFLLGNHEDMAYCVIARDPKRMKPRYGSYRSLFVDDAWVHNGGLATIDGLARLTDPDWRANVLLPWMESLSPWAVVDVAGREVMLVHAGFDPTVWSLGTFFWCDGLDDGLARAGVIEVGHGFGKQEAQVMLWARRGWYDHPQDAPLETVFGHSPTTMLTRDALEHDAFGRSGGLGDRDTWLDTVPRELGRIWHYRNRHDVDCGCAYGGCLAALRLDDLEEVYVDGPSLW